MRLVRGVGFWAGVLLLLGSMAACGEPERVAGCRVPPDEKALLDAYADDPVFDIRPDGAQPRDGVQRSMACVRLNMEDVSNTSVQASYTVTRPVTHSQLRTAYDSVATGAGWHAYTLENNLPTPVGEFRLGYCRTVRGTTSLLDIWTQPPQSVDVRPSNTNRPSEPIWQVSPGIVVVGIRAAPEKASCP